MTSAVRETVRQERDRLTRARITQDLYDCGLDFCDVCNDEIAAPRPGKKFCSVVCQKRFHR